MSDQDLYKQVGELQRQIQFLTSEKVKMEAELASLRRTLGVPSGLSAVVAELMNYAVSAKATQTQLAPTIAHLRAVQTIEEARAIGNSLDALFRATPVPQVLMRG